MAVVVVRRRRGQVVAIGAVALLVLGFVASSWMDTLRVELELETRSFEPGEPVHFALNVCSNSLLPMRTDDGKASWRIINEAGDVVADSSHQVFTLERKTFRGRPGSVDRSCRWIGISASGTSDRLEPVRPQASSDAAMPWRQGRTSSSHVGAIWTAREQRSRSPNRAAPPITLSGATPSAAPALRAAPQRALRGEPLGECV